MHTDRYIERFWKKVVVSGDNECWIWSAGRDNDGYGRFWDGTRLRGAHQFSWEIHNGPIPAGLCVCHTCDVRPCVNPSHLFLATNELNSADRAAKGRSASGDRHGSRTHPECLQRGDAHWVNRRPECVPCGAQRADSKLTEDDVREIRKLHAAGVHLSRRLASHFGVDRTLLWRIAKRKTWRHVL